MSTQSGNVLYVVSEVSDLATLALPAGWSISSRVLERDLVMIDASSFPQVYLDAQQKMFARQAAAPPDSHTPEHQRPPDLPSRT